MRIQIILLLCVLVFSACAPATSPTQLAWEVPPLPTEEQVQQPVDLNITAPSHITPLVDSGFFSGFSSWMKTTYPDLPAVNIHVATNTAALDLRNMIQDADNKLPVNADVVIVPSSLWVPARSVNAPPATSSVMMKTYNFLAVEKSALAELGWDSNNVLIQDVIDGVTSAKLHALYASAPTADQGVVPYIAMSTKLCGSAVLLETCLNDPVVTSRMTALLTNLSRTAEDAESLMVWYKNDKTSGANAYNAIFLYEAQLIQLNSQLEAMGKEPLMAVYVKGATAVSDTTIRCIDNGNKAKVTACNKFIEYSKTSQAKAMYSALGYRTAFFGMTNDNPNVADDGYDLAVFREDWNIETKTTFASMFTPAKSVLHLALTTYQTSFRKPTVRLMCIDLSDSEGMINPDDGQSEGLEGIDVALWNTLIQRIAKENYTQAGPYDVLAVWAFATDSSVPLMDAPLVGDDAKAFEDLYAGIHKQFVDRDIKGATNMYGCVRDGYLWMMQFLKDSKIEYSPSIVVFTDGNANTWSPLPTQNADTWFAAPYGTVVQDNYNTYQSEFEYFYKTQVANSGYTIPTYAIGFGGVNPEPLKIFEDLTGGKVYDATVAGGDLSVLKVLLRQVFGNN